MREVNTMIFVKRYLIPRLISYFLVIWLGITVVFLIPRLTPNDPVMKMVDQMRARHQVGTERWDEQFGGKNVWRWHL